MNKSPINHASSQRGLTHKIFNSLIVSLLFVFLPGCEDETIPTKKVVSVDHSILDRVLRACVTSEGLVDYKLLRSEYADELDEYIDYLGRIDPEHLPLLVHSPLIEGVTPTLEGGYM